MADWIVAVVVATERANGHEAVRREVVDGDEQAELGDTGNAAVELCADLVAHPGGDVAGERIAFGRRGAALGHRDVIADGVEIHRAAVEESAFAELESGDQRAVD